MGDDYFGTLGIDNHLSISEIAEHTLKSHYLQFLSNVCRYS